MQKKITSPSYFIGKSKPGLISFGSGQPDLPPPAKVYHTFDDHKNFKYGLVQGEEILRRAIATQYPNASAQQFVITNGASEALDLTLRCLRHNGRKILLPRPYYYSYPYNVQFAGLEPVFYDLEKGKINMHNFKKVLDGCSAVLINSPSNPTGSIQDIAVLQEIEKITQEKNIYVISDEVYKDLIYERENYLIKGPHVVTINSFSKTYSMCGYRIGYLFSTDIDFINDVI
ncbi:MAG TPA: pyridoxal phosphate-dependent aminotransferase, partial [Spirochaetota bacterium]|nr:pyridoxal phosphate-dependent aminotransferase [Spirochaetota bacterium]